ncbi:hypothetical protein MARI151_30366 [Maribacter litoralis]|uniref:Uncharacterized protein n=1 Tax=Maribacter litoralis TaxID=2059726 RepID=A0A653SXK7_9FLAO|nr:hypothetical protein MARI151_30366 [Maribacter litoralis]
MPASGTAKSIKIKHVIINLRNPLSILTPEESPCSIIIVLLFCIQYRYYVCNVL